MTTNKTRMKRAGFGAAPALTAGILAAGTFAAAASADYGPAYWRPACNGHWNTSGNGKKFYVVHSMEGYYWGTIYHFQNCNVNVSVHYSVNGKKDTSSDAAPGEVTQHVADAHYGWHAKCWNGHSMGTEHEGFVSNPAWFTPELYSASAALTSSKAAKYGIAKDRNRIVGHNAESVAGWANWASSNLGVDGWCNTHSDPGPYWDWSGYMALLNGGGAVRGTPTSTTVDTVSGRLLTFAIWSDTSVRYNYQPTETTWSGWTSLGGVGFSSIGGLSVAGKFMVFGCGPGGPVFWNYQSTVAGAFSGWVSLDGAGFTKVKPVKLPDDRVVVFATSSASDIWYRMQTTAGGTTWTAWTAMGGSGFNSIDAVALSDGRLAVFGTGNGTSPWVNTQTAPGGSWGGFVSLGGSGFTFVRGVVRPDNRLAVFGTSDASDVYNKLQNADGTWPTAWYGMGGSGFSHIQPVVLSDGRMAFFGGSGNTQPWYKVQTAAGSSWPTAFSSLAGSGFGSFDVVVRSGNRINVMGHGTTGGTLYHNYQSTGGGAFQANWSDLGASLAY